MASLLLVGLSREALALAQYLDHSVAAVVDPRLSEGSWHGVKGFRSDEEAADAGEFDAALFAIDEPLVRKRVQSWYAGRGIAAQSLIAGSVGPGTEYGPGLFMQRLVHLSADCRLGDGVRLNVGANVMHNADIGSYVTIAPGAIVLGRVSIGEASYIGSNATIMPDRRVGNSCTVGAGAVVTRDVADGQTVAGVPARCLS